MTGGSITSYCRLDGRPIAGGRTRLDAEGRFQVPTCDEGICLSFSHTSMIQGGAWELAGSGSGTRLQARPLARVRGHVVDTHGAAVSAAKISLRALVDDAMALPSFVSSSATSDTEGAFDFVRVEHPPCDGCRQLRGACAAAEQAADAAEDAVFRLVARHPDFAPSEQRLTFNALENLEIRLPPALPPIQGRLLGRDQRPYARSKLHLRSEARPYERQLIEAAPDGRFEFRGLGPGTYTIVAIQDGVDLVRRQGIRAGDGQVDLLGPSDAAGRDLELRFVDGSGSPLSGVVVQGGPVGRSRLPEDGRLEVRAVVPGAYVLYLSRPGGGRIRQVFELQSGPSAQTSFEFVIELRRP